MTRGQSQSARANSAHEAAFRQHYAHSRGRNASLIALDPTSEALVESAVAALPERRRQLRLPATGTDADMVVVIATAGADAQAAALFGAACRLRGVPVTALVIADAATQDAALARTLGQLRPVATMVVVATGPDYVEDMLLALRA